MRIVEIRDLDGPNLFLMSPAIKVEIGDVPDNDLDDVIASLTETVRDLHRALDIEVPETASMRMETPGQIVVAFQWNRRAFAERLGHLAAELLIGERSDRNEVIEELRRVLAEEPQEDDSPLMLRAREGRIPIVSVTGTNGKTTTSRFIAFVLHHAGYKTGLTSSAGVSISKKLVLEGDYSGPSGARRVLNDPSVEFAVLETARGGLLLRGAGFEAADVAVVTNVAEDHLGAHGIHSIEGLAAVKAIVARNVRPGGFCVLNADNEHVLAMREVTPGLPVLFSPDPNSEPMRVHIEGGGAAISIDADRNVVWFRDGNVEIVTPISDIPMTFDGRAPHQVENALAGIAALIGLGIDHVTIRRGAAAFKSTAENSKGRLNVFEVNGATVIIDFAHNEAGLRHLLTFARNYVEENGKLIAVVGTAGDRDNQALQAIARRGVSEADIVVIKDSLHYLRGREPGEMLAEMRSAAEQSNNRQVEIVEAADERSATLMMLEQVGPADVLAVMCIEDYDFLLKELGARGTVKA